MPAVVIVGGQWGDEGKGRIVDLVSQKAHLVARYSAGNNAGHTVINDLGEFKLHLVPAGIFYPDKVCVIGNGVAVDPAVLLDEVDQLNARGVSTERLVLSDRAHVIMPYHPLLDRLEEERRGKHAIGTTGRGVGPAFLDKVGRTGIRVADLVEPEALRERLSLVLEHKNRQLAAYGADPLDFAQVYERYCDYGRRLAPYVRDTSALVHEALARGETVLLEGAQGTLLDLDTGTYEFVTASVPSSLAAGAGVGIGIGPTQITRVFGVYKAYVTRVGNGPMPTEIFGADAERIRQSGHEYLGRIVAQEYGATTGRPRRCGWFDAVACRYTARVNGLTGMAITRLDVLDQFQTIKVCTAYEIDGERSEQFPASAYRLARATPVYEELPGWGARTTEVRRFQELPKQAQNYVRRLEALLEVPAFIVSVGPEREQAIVMKPVL